MIRLVEPPLVDAPSAPLRFSLLAVERVRKLFAGVFRTVFECEIPAAAKFISATLGIPSLAPLTLHPGRIHCPLLQ